MGATLHRFAGCPAGDGEVRNFGVDRVVGPCVPRETVR
jgi:hypothetical protein